jgi:hypothetical protein
MLNVATRTIPLRAHPTTQDGVVQSLDVHLVFERSDLLTLRYDLRGDLSRICIGTEGPPGRADNLWQHTCFEVFIQPAGSTAYYEFNFSPTKQWAVYRLDAYRKGLMPMEVAYPPEISIHQSPGCLELGVTFHLPISYAVTHRPKLALTAVVEQDGGRLSYWSAQHAEGKPDFHHPDGFIVEL